MSRDAIGLTGSDVLSGERVDGVSQGRRLAWIPLGLVIASAVVGALISPAGGTGAEGLVAADIAWMLTASGLVLLMTPGLSFFYGGMVRSKNVISTMLQSFIAIAAVSVLWVVVGFSLAFGDSIGGTGMGLIGNPLTFAFFRNVGAAPDAALSPTIPLILFAVFQMKFAIITPALVTGSFAERSRFTAYMLFMVLFVLFIYTPVAHWTWHPNGFLRSMGVLDFAGGTVVHLTAGIAALAGSIVFGPRKDFQRGVAHAPAKVPYVLLGTGMLWFGWFGFNAGSALAANDIAANAFLTTNTASAAAVLTWVLIDLVRGRKPTALGASVAAVVGLVAITPAAGYVGVGSSIAIGLMGAAASYLAVHWKNKSDLDDTLDVFPCHGIGGMVGVIATALFANTAVNAAGADGLLLGNGKLMVNHLIALGIVGVYSFAVSFLLFKAVDFLVPLRVSHDEELEGLDRSQHGESVG